MDAQTISVLAATAVGFMSPYLTQAGEAAVKKLGEDVYKTLKTYFSKKTIAQETLNDLERNPTDSDTQAALRLQLKKLLAQDETFANQLQDLLRQSEDFEAGTTVIKQIAGNNAKQFGQVFGNINFK